MESLSGGVGSSGLAVRAIFNGFCLPLRTQHITVSLFCMAKVKPDSTLELPPPPKETAAPVPTRCWHSVCYTESGSGSETKGGVMSQELHHPWAFLIKNTRMNNIHDNKFPMMSY